MFQWRRDLYPREPRIDKQLKIETRPQRGVFELLGVLAVGRVPAGPLRAVAPRDSFAPRTPLRQFLLRLEYVLVAPTRDPEPGIDDAHVHGNRGFRECRHGRVLSIQF